MVMMFSSRENQKTRCLPLRPCPEESRLFALGLHLEEGETLLFHHLESPVHVGLRLLNLVSQSPNDLPTVAMAQHGEGVFQLLKLFFALHELLVSPAQDRVEIGQNLPLRHLLAVHCRTPMSGPGPNYAPRRRLWLLVWRSRRPREYASRWSVPWPECLGPLHLGPCPS